MEALNLSLAPVTRMSYSHHLHLFNSYLISQGFDTSYPQPIFSIMAFVIHLLDLGRMHSTILPYVSAIAFGHKVRGLPDPTATFLFRKFLRGIKNSATARPRLDPISFWMLQELVHLVDYLHITVYHKALIRAIMSLMYHGCLRISEIGHSGSSRHALRDDKVAFHICPPRSYPRKISITLLSFKHSKAPQAIDISPIADRAVCPVVLLWEYCRIRPPSVTFFCDSNGRPVTRTFVMAQLRKLVALSSFPSKRLNTHSFRIGRTTDLVLKGGVSDAYIRHVGRWSSTAYLKYIRSVVVL